MLSTLVAYGLIGCFLGIEGLARQGQEAKSLEAARFDRGSTRLLGVAFLVGVLALLLAPLLNAFQVGTGAYGIIGWVGIGLMASGIALRFWANRVLGRFYTRTLRIADDQQIIEQGPYKILRHPGYTGVLLMWAGAGLATVNWITAAGTMLVMLGAYGYRIECEEGMLLATLGPQYESYRARTRKLVPFLY